jgi:hypothetical protein
MARKMKNFILLSLLAGALAGCGGGSGTATAPVPVIQKLVGEIIATPAEIASSELKTTAGYAGNVSASSALQAAGKENLLDMLFMLNGAGTNGRDRSKISDDAAAKLAQYVRDSGHLLTPGVRVLIADEVFWNPPDTRDTDEVLQPQLEALRAAVSMIRQHIPQAKVGITVSPYAVAGRPHTLEYISKAVAVVDWVGTDPYWFGDNANLQSLDDWSRTFNAVAKQANPRVETWFIAQAFKAPAWDSATFNRFITAQLSYAEQYDHVLFFGWQFTSELNGESAGINFPPDTKQLYRKYLKDGVQ